MTSFDFFRARRSGYAPRSPAAALKAIGTGVLSSEHFIYASTSAKPLDEEPYDLDLIERVLAREKLTIETKTFIKTILERIIRSPEQERALFGAEGITAIEAHSIHAIEALKSKLAKKSSPQNWKTLARHYYELAVLHGRGSSLMSFYLRKAYASLGRSHRKGPISRRNLILLVDVLVNLGLPTQAEQVLRHVRPTDDSFVLLLAARVAFHRSNYSRVIDCCRRLAPHAERLSEKDQRLIAFWTSEAAAGAPGA